MKNIKEEPKEYFERNITLVICILLSSLVLDVISFNLLIDVNPWGSATAIPGLILTFQALWLLVNPYAIVYEDRFEIKQSLIYNREFYFLDAKDIELKSMQKIHLVYNDGDLEKIPLFGMRGSHKGVFKDRLVEKIKLSLNNRDF